jgi:hypothetical protein
MKKLSPVSVLKQRGHATENRSVGGSFRPLGANDFNCLAASQNCHLDAFLLELDNFVRFLLPASEEIYRQI